MWLRRLYPTTSTPDCSGYLLCVPGELAGIVAGKLLELLQREQWDTREDWEQGAAAIKEILASMACIDRVTTRLDRLIAGLGYTAALEATDPAYDAADTQLAALERLRAGLSTGDTTLDDVIAYINQTETYLKGIADLLGSNTLPSADP